MIALCVMQDDLCLLLSMFDDSFTWCYMVYVKHGGGLVMTDIFTKLAIICKCDRYMVSK